MQVSKVPVRRVAALGSLILFAAVGQALAQQPTQAQRDAIRSSCRSDFMVDCSGVTPGGKEALDCLKQNLAKLSASCQSAVSAITPAAPAPAPVPAAIAAPPPQQAPSTAPPTVPKPATAAKPAAPKPATAPVAKLNPSAPAPPPVAAAPVAVPAVPPLTPRPMLPQRRLLIVRICRPDVERFCAGMAPGEGRIVDCLAANAASLSPPCYDAIARVSR